MANALQGPGASCGRRDLGSPTRLCERNLREIDNIDPYTGETVAGNQLRVRKLSVDEALRKYGHDSHHGRTLYPLS